MMAPAVAEDLGEEVLLDRKNNLMVVLLGVNNLLELMNDRLVDGVDVIVWLVVRVRVTIGAMMIVVRVGHLNRRRMSAEVHGNRGVTAVDVHVGGMAVSAVRVMRHRMDRMMGDDRSVDRVTVAVTITMAVTAVATVATVAATETTLGDGVVHQGDGDEDDGEDL